MNTKSLYKSRKTYFNGLIECINDYFFHLQEGRNDILFIDMLKFEKLNNYEKFKIWLMTPSIHLAIIGETNYQRALVNARLKKYEEQLKSEYKYKINDKVYVPDTTKSYGYKYCHVFTHELMPKLTEGGKKWLKQAKLNLQILMEKGLIEKNYISKYNGEYNDKNGLMVSESIEKFYENIELNDKNFKEFAFATHPDAYDPKAMSRLPVEDLFLILITPDLKEWRDTETWQQAKIMFDNMDIENITRDTWERTKDKAEEIVEEFIQKGQKIIDEEMKKIKQHWDELF